MVDKDGVLTFYCGEWSMREGTRRQNSIFQSLNLVDQVTVEATMELLVAPVEHITFDIEVFFTFDI